MIRSRLKGASARGPAGARTGPGSHVCLQLSVPVMINLPPKRLPILPSRFRAVSRLLRKSPVPARVLYLQVFAMRDPRLCARPVESQVQTHPERTRSMLAAPRMPARTRPSRSKMELAIPFITPRMACCRLCPRCREHPRPDSRRQAPAPRCHRSAPSSRCCRRPAVPFRRRRPAPRPGSPV